jgi:hypothetical protein
LKKQLNFDNDNWCNWYEFLMIGFCMEILGFIIDRKSVGKSGII